MIIDKEDIIKGALEATEIIKNTMGPYGQKVLIGRSINLPAGAKANRQDQIDSFSRDGVTILRHLPDHIEGHGKIGARLVIQSSDSTVKSDGDGTSTTAALINGLLTHLRTDYQYGVNEDLDDFVKDFCEFIDAIAQPAKDDWYEKAVISAANNLEHVGRPIAEMVKSVGPDGQVSPEYSKHPGVSTEVRPGYKLERGLLTQPFLDAKPKQGQGYVNYGDRVVLNNPMVLVAEEKLETIKQMEAIYRAAGFAGQKVIDRPLLIIAGQMQGEALRFVLQNLLEHPLQIPVFVVQSPAEGNARFERLRDIATACGTKVFSKVAQTTFQGLKSEDQFGSAESVILSLKDGLIRFEEKNKPAVDELVEQLRGRDDDDARERVSLLTTGVGIVKIGGYTQAELGYLGQVVEDAVLAAQSILKNGVVPGCGWSYYEFSKNLKGYRMFPKEAFAAALCVVHNTVMENAGLKPSLPGKLENLVTKEVFDNPWNAGVYVSTGVVKSAMQNAVSLVKEIIQTQKVLSNEV